MKIQVAVLLGIQAVYEVDAREISPGVWDIMPSLNGEIDIKSTCIAGSMQGVDTKVKEQVTRSVEQALATMVGANYKPADAAGAKKLNNDLVTVN